MRVIELAAAVAAVALVGVLLVTRHAHATAGGSSSSSHGAGSGTATTSAGSGSAGSQAAKIYLPKIEKSVLAAKQVSFKAVYQAKGLPTTLTFAQVGTQSSFATGTTTFYLNGTKATICDNSGGKLVCYATSPLDGLLSLVSPANEANAIREALAANLTVTHSNERHDGEMSSCIAYSKTGQRVKYCTDGQGIVTFIKMPDGAFVLSSYTTNVSVADVSVPPGAQIVPAPSKSQR